MLAESPGEAISGKQAFVDLISHSDDPELVKRATVGIWVASAQGNDRDKLEMEKSKTALDERFPWMDKTKTAAEIFDTLANGLNAKTKKEKSPTLQELKIAYLRMPPRSLWPQMRFRSSPGLNFVEIQNFDSGVLASTRKVLAAFASDGGSPTWSDLGTGGNWGHSASRVGQFRPIAGKKRIFTRWGYSADPTKLIAMDEFVLLSGFSFALSGIFTPNNLLLSLLSECHILKCCDFICRQADI